MDNKEPRNDSNNIDNTESIDIKSLEKQLDALYTKYTTPDNTITMETRIADVKFSNSPEMEKRIHNALSSDGINTIEELLQRYNDTSLLGIRNLGEKSREFVVAFVTSASYMLPSESTTELFNRITKTIMDIKKDSIIVSAISEKLKKMPVEPAKHIDYFDDFVSIRN